MNVSVSFLIDPDGPHVGHAAIDEAVEQLLRRFPDFVFSERGALDAYHGVGGSHGASGRRTPLRR